VLLDEGSDLLVGSMGSVWDSHEEVLGGGSIGLLVVNGVNTVDKDDLQMCLKGLVVKLELVERLGNLLFEISWLNTVFLDYLISSIEHLCLLLLALRNCFLY